MAVITIPDKFIRKAISDKINNIVVSGKTIKCFDSRVTGSTNYTEYILTSVQSKDVLKDTKCSYEWDTSTLIEIYTKYPLAGNTGSRLLLNDIESAVWALLQPKLVIENFTNVTQNVSFEYSGLETVSDIEVIYRSFLRINLILT
jgi:hypothetical protein